MSTAEINRIVSVKVVADHTVELQFSDGFVGRIDLSPALWGEVFTALQDPAFFRQVRIEDETIRWPNEADFCPDVLRYWCASGGIQSREKTDAHFARIETVTATT